MEKKEKTQTPASAILCAKPEKVSIFSHGSHQTHNTYLQRRIHCLPVLLTKLRHQATKIHFVYGDRASVAFAHFALIFLFYLWLIHLTRTALFRSFCTHVDVHGSHPLISSSFSWDFLFVVRLSNTKENRERWHTFDPVVAYDSVRRAKEQQQHQQQKHQLHATTVAGLQNVYRIFEKPEQEACELSREQMYQGTRALCYSFWPFHRLRIDTDSMRPPPPGQVAVDFEVRTLNTLTKTGSNGKCAAIHGKYVRQPKAFERYIWMACTKWRRISTALWGLSTSPSLLIKYIISLNRKRYEHTHKHTFAPSECVARSTCGQYVANAKTNTHAEWTRGAHKCGSTNIYTLIKWCAYHWVFMIN